MQKMSGVMEQSQEDRNEDTNRIMSRLMELMHNKYGDIILLCSVTLAFGMLLAVSASG
ncbi:MAG: hypothetical protein WA137_07280 [Methanothrix sp.]